MRLRRRLRERLSARALEFIGEGEQDFAGRGERDAAVCTLEERNGQFGLERFNLLGDGGLGEQEFFGGLAKVQVSRDGAKDPESEIFHGYRLQIRGKRRGPAWVCGQL